MTNKRIPVFVAGGLMLSMLVVQSNAIAPAGFFTGCEDCRASVVAFCDGGGYEDEEDHKYNKFLGLLGGNTCVYTEIYHDTTEYCEDDPTHVNPGETILAGEEGHTYDDVGKNACGMDDYDPCRLNSEAYRT